jgi:hypothetical protein
MYYKLEATNGKFMTVEDRRCLVVEFENDGEGTALFDIAEISSLRIKDNEANRDFAKTLPIQFKDGSNRDVYVPNGVISAVFPESLTEDTGTYKIMVDYTDKGYQLRLSWLGVSTEDADKVSAALTVNPNEQSVLNTQDATNLEVTNV